MPEVRVICSNLIEKDKRFLLVKETKHVAKDKFSLPAGKLEGNEALIEGAVREAKEETGLVVKPTGIVGIYQKPVSRDGGNVTVIVFKSDTLSGNVKTSAEHPVVEFFSIPEIKEMHAKGMLRGDHVLFAAQDHLDGQDVGIEFWKKME